MPIEIEIKSDSEVRIGELLKHLDYLLMDNDPLWQMSDHEWETVKITSPLLRSDGWSDYAREDDDEPF